MRAISRDGEKPGNPKVASARNFATLFALFATLFSKQRPETLDSRVS
jgi:hypothetical protein